MSKNKTSAAADWLKKIGIGVIQGVAINVVTEKLAPGAKKFAEKVLDKMAVIQGRKDLEDLDNLAKTSESNADSVTPAQPPLPITKKSPTILPPVSTKNDTVGPIEAKFT